jgi:hypothetical protein
MCTADMDQNSYGSRQDTVVGYHEQNTEHGVSIELHAISWQTMEYQLPKKATTTPYCQLYDSFNLWTEKSASSTEWELNIEPKE